MNKKSIKIDKEAIKIVLILGAIALIASLLLGVIHKVTLVDEVERFREKIGNNYYSALVDRDIDISNYNNLPDSQILNVFVAENGAVVVLAKALKAYKGLELIVIINDDVVEKIITNKTQETPGLGSKALDNSYLSKFINKNVADFDVVSSPSLVPNNPASNVSGATTPSKTEIDNISGATISSVAVKKTIDGAVAVYLYLQDKGVV